MKKSPFVAILTLIFMSSLHGQYFESYKWKNRLVLVISRDRDSRLLKDQLKILEEDIDGMVERKLQIFKILPDQNISTDTDDNFVVNESIYNHYTDKDDKFKIILIGLDGKVKLEQNNIISRKKLYDLIDSMPMRQTEMNKN